MRHRTARLGLFLLFLAALGVAAWLVAEGERAVAAEAAAARSVETAASRAAAMLADARAALPAAVAVGQGHAFWRERAASALASVAHDLEVLREAARDPGALNEIDAATTALADTVAVTDRIGRLLRDNQPAAASSLIFAEGIRAVAAVSSRVGSAAQAEEAASERRIAEVRLRQAAALGGAAAIALIVAGLLLPAGGGSRRESMPVGGQVNAASPLAGAGAAAALAERPISQTAWPEASAARASAAGTPAQPPEPDVPQRDRRRATELRAAADFCTDLARLLDAEELPGLLERAARLIDATGFIVWVADAGGTELRPALAHGYTSQTLARLPAIPRGADNATAAAWRSGEVQVVKTNGMSPGALAVPLLTAAGCMGVLAAEIRHGRESSDSVRALARLVAAQLATLVSLPEADAASTASPAAGRAV
jgi:hypothetical protein